MPVGPTPGGAARLLHGPRAPVSGSTEAPAAARDRITASEASASAPPAAGSSGRARAPPRAAHRDASSALEAAEGGSATVARAEEPTHDARGPPAATGDAPLGDSQALPQLLAWLTAWLHGEKPPRGQDTAATEEV